MDAPRLRRGCGPGAEGARAAMDAPPLRRGCGTGAAARENRSTRRACWRGCGTGAQGARAARGAPELARVRGLRPALLAWFGRYHRPLAWRERGPGGEVDPYAVWISEAMLQQTRAETVEPYWRRFLHRFPSARELAEAREDEVLAHWSGLGYYRRARALHAAARAIVERHGGRFPREPSEARALPGVGRYTAGAVLSIGFDLPEPVVDGNVARVFCRLFALDGDPAAGALRERLWGLAAALVPRRGAGEWNQALMELGATTCLPREPDCGRCPIARGCAARAAGRERELPRARKRAAPLDVALEILLVRRGGEVLLERRAGEGRMAGLWQLPTVELEGPAGRRSGLFPPEYARRSGGAAVLEAAAGEPLAELRHTITRHRIRARLFAGRVLGRGALPDPLSWVAEEQLAAWPLSGMARKGLAAGSLAGFYASRKSIAGRRISTARTRLPGTDARAAPAGAAAARALRACREPEARTPLAKRARPRR
jgi:A/G-specific adenine glycosylase